MSDYVSDVLPINHPINQVYNCLSDLNNLELLKKRMQDPALQDRVKSEAPQFGGISWIESLDKLSCDTDRVTIGGLPMMGDVSLEIIERESPKTIKFQGVGTPMAANMWIQLVPTGEDSCKMKLTLRADMNFFTRQLLGGHLQKGVQELAKLMANIPYRDVETLQETNDVV